MRPYVIVFGNEKGGTGKSTVALHVTVCLLYKGMKVGTIDIDARQGTLTRYLEQRQHNASLPMPIHKAVFKSENDNRVQAQQEEKNKFEEAMQQLSDRDFIIIDTPGNDTYLSQLAHSYADTLITPLNESFVDMDVLVRVTGGDMRTMRPSVYAEMVWNQRKNRAIRRQKPIDWIVIRNRITTLYNKNRKDIGVVLEALSKRIGFRLGTGFCERVIFKELFVSGMTLLDLERANVQLSLSHVAARQELRDLINFMHLPGM